MNKRTIALIAAVVFLLLVVILAKATSKSSPPPTTFAAAKQEAKKNPPACLATKEDAQLKVSDADKTQIPITVVAQLTDVPAGTGVDVFLSSYDGKTANGSSIYTGNYGKYNFTAKKSAKTEDKYKGSWQVTQFVTCKYSPSQLAAAVVHLAI